MKCWVAGHDWEILERFCWSWDNGIPIEYHIKVCLKCEKVVDEIYEAKRRIEAMKKRRGSRQERAKAIYQEHMSSW